MLRGAPVPILERLASGFILLNMVHVHHPIWIGSLSCTTSSVDARQGFRKSFSGSVGFIILFQTIINTLLLLWVYEEYLNNIYFAAYLNDQVATAGWMFGLGALVLILGSLSFVFFHRNKGVKLDITGIQPLPVKRATASMPRVVAPAKPAESFHPVVAALKAEMHGISAPFGASPRTTPGAMTLQSPVQRFEDKTGLVQGPTSVLRIQGAIPDASQTAVATPLTGAPSTIVTSAISKKPEKEGSAEQKPSS